MRCEQIRQWLPDYVVGGLTAEACEQVAEHLPHCPECAEEMALLNRTGALLDALPMEEPPAQLWQGVESQIAQPKGLARWVQALKMLWQGRLPIAATALALLLLIVGGLILHEVNREPESPLSVELEQYTFSLWNDPFADRAALGLLVAPSVEE